MAKLTGILPENPLAATMIRVLVLFVCMVATLAPAITLAANADLRASMHWYF